MIKKLLIVITLVGIGIIALWIKMNAALDSKLQSPRQVIEITTGSTIHSVSKQLVKLGVIETRFWLRNYARLFPSKARIKAGHYLLTPDDSLRSLLEKLVLGKEHQLTITFIEGSTMKEWLVQLKADKNIVPTNATQNLKKLASVLKLTSENPEGWFFPDTYSFTIGTADIEILSRANNTMKNILNEYWQNRAINLPYNSPYEALIMASIIEKETAVVDEQPLIAAVFINRLRKKMRLQTDPTVIYGLGERYKGDITRAHLREKTAYNTYRINGLPPTPIAMPGKKAIQAALNPAQSEYLYFVSKGDGSHYFSTTLQEHNRAVNKYQLGKGE